MLSFPCIVGDRARDGVSDVAVDGGCASPSKIVIGSGRPLSAALMCSTLGRTFSLDDRTSGSNTGATCWIGAIESGLRRNVEVTCAWDVVVSRSSTTSCRRLKCDLTPMAAGGLRKIWQPQTSRSRWSLSLGNDGQM